MLGQSQGKGLIHLLSENCWSSLFTVNLRSASHLNFQVQKVAMSRAFIMQYCNILSSFLQMRIHNTQRRKTLTTYNVQYCNTTRGQTVAVKLLWKHEICNALLFLATCNALLSNIRRQLISILKAQRVGV